MAWASVVHLIEVSIACCRCRCSGYAAVSAWVGVVEWAVSDVGVAVEVGGVGGVGDDGVCLGEAGRIRVVVAGVVEQQAGAVVAGLVRIATVGWQFLGCWVYGFPDECVC